MHLLCRAQFNKQSVADSDVTSHPHPAQATLAQPHNVGADDTVLLSDDDDSEAAAQAAVPLPTLHVPGLTIIASQVQSGLLSTADIGQPDPDIAGVWASSQTR